MNEPEFLRKVEVVDTPTHLTLDQFALRLLATGMGVFTFKEPFVATFNIHPCQAYNQKTNTYLVMIAIDEIVYIDCKTYKKYLFNDSIGELRFSDSIQDKNVTKFWPITNTQTDMSRVAMTAIEKHEKKKKQ